ncbi:MAG: exo-beta-N-acetylmuramidase NamZ domain-containing protein [Pseudomonadota bacterium]
MKNHRAYPRKKASLLFVFMAWILLPIDVRSAGLAPVPSLTPERLAPIEAIVEEAINNGKTPGVVVLIGNNGKIVYRRAFGNRSLDPRPAPMKVDTLFDLASLTKVVATSAAIMKLVDEKKLSLNDPVVKYWPSFKKNGKSNITIKQLLTHYSGLRAGLNLSPRWSGYGTALKKIVDEVPGDSPGSSFTYSDINFIILGEIVKRVSGQSLNRYCAKHIFGPLSMRDTRYAPSLKQKERIAPTDYRDGQLIYGVVHDPSCYAMGGICGNAGLFSTAGDLSKFAEMMLNRGTLEGVRILKPETVDWMTKPQSPPGKKRLYGLGWDMEMAYEGGPKPALSTGSYGHLGYTGTALWIDPETKTYIIVLTNRTHSKGGGDVKALRSAIKEVVADALGLPSGPQPQESKPQMVSDPLKEKKAASVSLRTGVDVLSDSGFSLLAGLRVGLITNHTGRDSSGRRTIDLLNNARGVKLMAIFSPEHGLAGTSDETVASTVDAHTGLPVYSLFGTVKKPTDKMLKGLDALVFDIQDAGVRFYTYISTMGYAMEAAAQKGIAFYVLDRPNPITAFFVQGPVSSEQKRSFTSYFAMPIRHGMTVGELARMFNDELKIGIQLTVVKMQGYLRTQWYDETGLEWINPSPNLRSLVEATLYPGVALVEGANVSVGRGTPTPFEILGSPWIDAGQLSGYLQGRDLAGVKIAAIDFTPVESIYINHLCHGVKITVVDRAVLDTALLGIEIVNALYRLYPHSFKIDDTAGLIGSRSILAAIKEGQDPKEIAGAWHEPLEGFCRLREKYLLYPSPHSPTASALTPARR